MAINYSPKIVTNGLVLCLDAANPKSYPGNGTVWKDLSGNERHATLFNNPTFDNNGVGSFIFDGLDDWARTENNGIGTGASIPHSMEMWVNFNVITGTRWWLAVLGQYGQGAHHWIGTSATGTGFGAWSASCQRNPNLLGINQWIHITQTFDGTVLKDYVNGVNGSSCVATGFNFTNSNFTIGLRLGSEAYFNGKVSSAKIYNRALSLQEIQQNFNAVRGRYGI